jgi:succinate dehydrogenase subunit C
VSSLLFLAQRATAVVLAFAVMGHLALIIHAERAGLTAGAVLARTRGNLWLLGFYAMFVVAAAIHAPIGLRNILIEWVKWRGRSLDLAMTALALALLLLGLRAAYAVYAA